MEGKKNIPPEIYSLASGILKFIEKSEKDYLNDRKTERDRKSNIFEGMDIKNEN